MIEAFTKNHLDLGVIHHVSLEGFRYTADPWYSHRIL